MKSAVFGVVPLLCVLFSVSDAAPAGSSSNYGLTDDELRLFKEGFERFDANGNGKLERTELRDAMEVLGQPVSEPELDEMMKAAGKEGEQSIDLDLFLQLMGTSIKKQDEDIKEAFRLFDKDNDGFISWKELQAFMETIMGEEVTDKDAKDMVDVADRDGDKQISYEEFVRMMLPDKV